MLRKIFGNNREEVVGGWRRLHGEDLYKLHATPHIISLMKSRRKLQRDTWHSWDRWEIGTLFCLENWREET